jgi:serine/threonine protein phosphatase PrpC
MPEIAGILMEASDPQAAVERLVGRANERGGPDNATAVLVRCTGGR